VNGKATRHSPTGDAGLASAEFRKDAPWLATGCFTSEGGVPQPEEYCLPSAPELRVQPFRKFGTGKADASLFAINPPDGLAFTSEGLLLATDAMNHRLQIFDPYSGEHIGSIGDAGLFKGEIVNIIAMHDGGLLICDETANQIYRFKRTADLPVPFRPYGPPFFHGEGFKKLCGMACDSKERLYIVDGYLGEVRRYLPDFKPDSSWKFQRKRSDNEFILRRTEGIAIDESSGMLFLTSEWDGMIHAFKLETGQWLGKSIGRGTDAFTGKPLGQSVFSASVEGLAILDNYLLAVDEGQASPSMNHSGHLLIFDLRSPVLYETDADKCRARMAAGVADGLAGWMGLYQSPDSVAVFSGNAKHPEPLIAVADQGAYQVLVYFWKDVLAALQKAKKEK